MKTFVPFLVAVLLVGCGHSPVYSPRPQVVQTAAGPKVCSSDGWDCRLIYPPPRVAVPYYFYYPVRPMGFVWTYTSPRPDR